jgi:flavin reductase (DIM6/NTAB) family NADH-FMN oxidoreductase RutF
MIYGSVRPSRHSYGLLNENGDFIMNLPSVEQIEKVDTCGVVSGRNVDKFEMCGFTTVDGTEVDAPLIAECPVNLECRTRQVLSLGVHDAFLAEILMIHVNEEFIDGKGGIVADFSVPVYSTATRSYHSTNRIEGAVYGFSRKTGD